MTASSLPMLKTAPASMTIDGRPAETLASFEVVNPAEEVPFAEAPICQPDQLEEAVAGAVRAFPAWRGDESLRRRLLRQCAQAILLRSDEIAALITREQGKPLRHARSEVEYAAQQFAEYAAMNIPCELLEANAEASTCLVCQPLGPVALITPWNFPIGTAAVKIAPALLMGNTAIIKPSPYAPLSPLLMGSIIGQILPPGVISVVSGGDDLGSRLARHPAIRKVSLTGSVDTGKRVMAACAADLKRVTLELGGNDPAIVLPDADPAAIARPILAAAFRNAGQVCSAIKRVYAHESVFPALLRALRETAQAITLGDGFDPASDMGPLTNRDQLVRVELLTEQARSDGGLIHTGGRRPARRGFFFEPTLITDMDEATPLVREEQFGPVLPIIPFRDTDEAIAKANDSAFGLSASIWTANPRAGGSIAAQLECGRVGINGHSRSLASAPFGGFKQSGIGRELGKWGLLSMSEMQVINIFNAPSSDARPPVPKR